MTYESNQVVSEVAVLYELALSVGQTLDLHENCDRFLKTLMARKDLAYASVWIHKKYLGDPDFADDESVMLMYANPGFRIRERLLPADHFILERLKDKDVFSLAEQDDGFDALVSEKRFQGGTFAIFKLGELGFLKLYSVRRKEAFDAISLNRLRQVIAKFSVSLEACIAYGSMSREITERQRAELEARESAKRLSRMVEDFPDGICLLDQKRQVILTNALGDDYLKALDTEFVDNVLVSVAGRSLEDLSKTRDGLATEIVLEEPVSRFFELNVHQIFEMGAVGEWLIKIRDVTRERAIQERTQQQDRLAAVGQLAAGIGHDLNNILTPVLGFAQLIQMRGDIPEEVKGELERIAVQGDRAAMLVRQILDFSRRSVVQRSKLDLVPFLKEAMKLLERTLPETIRMITEIERGHYVVDANLTQLQQVLTNLAVNARDAMPNGGEFRVTLSLLDSEQAREKGLSDSETGRWVAWRISDTGEGMASETLEHIFEPFFTTKAPGKGTGLGMAQVHGIVKQHGGDIVVESVPGKGSAFLIYLPCLDVAEDQRVEVAGVLPSGDGETVLVVEDEEAVREVIEAMLVQLNYRLLQAKNGEEALVLYETHQQDIAVVLTDVVMPEMGGIELFHRLHKIDADLPVVFMSGYAADGTENGQAEIPDQIAGFITKPATLDRLANTLSDILSKRVANR